MDVSRLQGEAVALGVRLDVTQAERLLRYVALLGRWNARFNLISRQDIGRIWSRHIFDSLSIAPLFLEGYRAGGLTVADIGTGAGLPGLPLAITLPQHHWLLLDRNQRKIRFLETVVAELGLENVAARVADLGDQVADDLRGVVDVVVSRAVDEPAGLTRLAAPLLKEKAKEQAEASARLILMTATTPAETGEDGPREPALPSGFAVSDVRRLAIPGLDRAHEVTIITRR